MEMWDFIEKFLNRSVNEVLGAFLITYSVGRFKNLPFKWANFFTVLLFVWGLRCALKGALF